MGSFGFSSLDTLPLSFNCGFISTFVYESSQGLDSAAAPRTWFCPQRPGCRIGSATWNIGSLTVPGTRELMARTAGNMVLLGLFLASVCSVPVGIVQGVAQDLGARGPWQYQIRLGAGGNFRGRMVLLGFFLDCGSSAFSED